MVRSSLQSIIQGCETAREVTIVGHVAPDGDSLGSSFALSHMLNSLGVKTQVASLDHIPARYLFLPGVDQIVTREEELSPNADLLIVLDCGDLRRTGLPEGYVSNLKVINIDHHASNVGSLGEAWVDASFAAVGQQIFRLAREAGWSVTPEVATCLYTALATDTGFFRHSNTTPEVLRDAALLLEAGADLRQVVEQAGERKTLEELCLIRESLATLRQEHLGRITLIEVPVEIIARCGVRPDEAEGMVDYARAVPGTEVAVLLRAVQTNVTRVSLRARAPWDVSKVAVSFGGGGHRLAAGCTINLPLDEARAEVIAAIKQVLDHD